MPVTYTRPDWLPEPIFRAIERDKKEKLPGVDYTVTELLAPARAAELVRRHDVQVAASEKLWALIGKGLHAQIDDGTSASENTLLASLDNVSISGTPDYISDRVIHDWKLCSVYAWIYGLKEEWVQQLNCYAWLCRRSPRGFEPSGLRIHMIFRDWHRSKVNGEDYPPTEAMSKDIPIWPDAEVVSFLRRRIALHEAAKQSLPDCSMEERWHRPGGIAVMKKGQKRALRVLDTEEEARAYAEEKNLPGLYLEPRPGKDIRCLDWCPARSVCNYALSLNPVKEQET